MDKRKMPVVITLHGIRTDGPWQKQIAPQIARYGMIPVLLDYGFLSLGQFLNPRSRDKLVHRIRDEIHAVQNEYPDVQISVVAHSLGTYLIARLIKEEGLSFETVLFAGSIVPADFSWNLFLDSHRVNYVANYVAQRDVWPKVASCLSPGIGRAGSDGFRCTHFAFFQDTHTIYRHSDYFNPRTFQLLWIPKLVLPQRQMIENLTNLLAQALLLLQNHGGAAMLSARARLFYKRHRDETFSQFPGMHVASDDRARYRDEELNYLVMRASTRGATIRSPRVFEAAFTGVPTEWTADDKLSTTARPDSVAMVASPLFSHLDRANGVIGMIAFEVRAPGVCDRREMVDAIKPLLPQLSQSVAQASADMQPFFSRYWP